MPLGAVLYESGATLSHVLFPMTSIVSLLYVMENGSSAEIAVVGREGIVACRSLWEAIRRRAEPSFKALARAIVLQPS
jgi:hypothetical protein